MGSDKLKFGGGAADTILSPVVLLAVVIAAAIICFGSRRRALPAFLTAGILVPVNQVLVLGGIHFPMLRILAICGFFRLFREKRDNRTWLFAGGFNSLDRCVILLTVVTAVNGIILFHVFGEVVYQAGNLCSVMGIYLLLRFLIRTEEDVVRTIQTFAWIVGAIAVIMAYEYATGHNPYSLLGGLPSDGVARVLQRDDKFRAQGPFGHSILAGTFGAVLAPLFAALWYKGKEYRRIAVVGMVGAIVMSVTSNSSTPDMAFAAGVFALCLWPARHWTREMRRGLVLALIILQLISKHPIWHLMVRIDIVGGSSGYHRYMLIDQCIRHFWQWCLVGVKDTGSWGWDMWDTADEYVSICDNSGLIPFILLILILVYGFKYLGRIRRAAEKDRNRAHFVWAIGCALFANAVVFFGISYWDQTQVAWYALLVMISAALATQKSKQQIAVQAARPGKVQTVPPAAGDLACAGR